jgi:hypothetical protein
MSIEIRDEDTIALVDLLAAHTGTSRDEAIAHAVDAALTSMDVKHGSYRERRNARVRARELESRLPFTSSGADTTPEAQPA